MQETREEESQGRRLDNKIHTRAEAECIVRFRDLDAGTEGKERKIYVRQTDGHATMWSDSCTVVCR